MKSNTVAPPSRMLRSFVAGMFRVVGWQIAATAGAALLVWGLSGTASMVSLLIGSLCCIVPNALFAVRLAMVTLKPASANPMDFFIGEFVKIAATIMLLVLAAKTVDFLVWWAVLAGMIVALKSYLLALTQ